MLLIILRDHNTAIYTLKLLYLEEKDTPLSKLYQFLTDFNVTYNSQK